MSKKCPVCGAEVEDDALSCPKCGADLSDVELDEEVELEKLLENLGDELEEEEELELPDVEDFGKEEDILGELESIVEGTEAEEEDVLPDIDDLEAIGGFAEEGEEKPLTEIEELVPEEKTEEIPEVAEEAEVPAEISEEAVAEEEVPVPSEEVAVEEVKAEEIPVEKAEVEEVSEEVGGEVAEAAEISAEVSEEVAEEEVPAPSEEVAVEEIKAEEIPVEKPEIAEVSEEAGGEVAEVAEAPKEVTEEVEVAEEEVVEEVVCPICEREIPPDAEECPYCGVVFGLEVSVEDVMKNLLQYIKQLMIFAKDMGVDTSDAMKYIKEAWGLASKEEYEEGVKRLVDARILLEHELSKKLERELLKYKKYTTSDAVKIVYDRVKDYWKKGDLNSSLPTDFFSTTH